MTVRRAFLAVIYTAFLLGLAWGCSAADSRGDFAPGSGATNGIGVAGNDELVLGQGGAHSTDGGDLVLNPLCGKGCAPDQVAACRNYVPPVAPNPDSGRGGSASTSEPATPSGGDGGDSLVSPAGAGGVVSDGGTGGSGGVSGAGAVSGTGAAGESGGVGGVAAEGGTPGTPVAPPEFACQVQRKPDDPNSVIAQCSVAGTGRVGDPCLTSSDCAAGYQVGNRKYGALGCVGNGTSGLCEPYCCKDDDSCEKGTYCAERPMRDAVSNAQAQGAAVAGRSLLIPVCIPAENCDLSTPYPCPAGTLCACKVGMACLVVRSDGTTTCAAPGAGKVGSACPCAWGHVCSATTNECLKLCYTRDAQSCSTGKCQSASELPDGWGVCVGG